MFEYGEDYDLWLRMAERYSLANLPERLLRYRHHDNKESLRHATAQRLATHVAKLCAKARRSGQGDPLEGRSSLSLDDLDRFDLAVGEREAIMRDVIGAAPTGRPSGGGRSSGKRPIPPRRSSRRARSILRQQHLASA